MSDLEIGHERINSAIALAKSVYPNRPIIFVEHLRMFGDILHSSIVVRHFRKAEPNAILIWGISERYAKEFDTSVGTPDGAHYIVGLPHGPEFPQDGPIRIAWTQKARTYGVKVVTPSVHPYGWKCGTIAEAIFDNAGIGIRNLKVPLTPWFPVDISDYAWNDQFLAANNLQKYVTIEYNSSSLKVHDPEWYKQLIKLVKLPVVALGGKTNYLAEGAIDCRGCTYRQAKVTIMRSQCFIGCASGNGVAAVSDGVETPLIEIVDRHMGHKHLGYIHGNRKFVCPDWDVSPEKVADIANKLCGI